MGTRLSGARGRGEMLVIANRIGVGNGVETLSCHVRSYRVCNREEKRIGV